MSSAVTFRWVETTKNYERFTAIDAPKGWIVGDIYKPLGAVKQDFTALIPIA